MCITKKATKKTTEHKDSSEDAKKKAAQKKPTKKFKIPMFAKKKKSAEPKVEEQKIEKPEEPEEPPKSVKEEEQEVDKREEDAKGLDEAKVEVKPKRPTVFRPNCANLAGLSGATKKKGNKYKFGQIDREELSINNDKTEFLENAQLTKLMSHADMKALMNGQNAPGENLDDPNCQDTVEEVDSEMQDIAFSPLLAPIPKEEDKQLHALIHPTDQKA
ncbi:hypothetical protein GCK72_008848 [Caenorhabditis remanei]|uniref:Uncharacterized protein n=1 Tax=Caenorhabditis remanei TaxID=31234 RepID=A0A6A5H0S2_CAERE|nr:hypothetical protein GCK72_008848 [Caenorhabditis remanei]KAF1760599.1 hypothetical protein GCK72_008848 [Caenorhabditis remanei]